MSCYAVVHFHSSFLRSAKPDFIFNGKLLNFKIVYGYMLCAVYIAKWSSDIGKAYSADGWGESLILSLLAQGMLITMCLEQRAF